VTDDVTRRTLLAAERTWLAWWRAGIAASAAAVGVGGVVPQLVGGERDPYIVLGAGYALLALAIFLGAGWRQARMEQALARGDFDLVGRSWVFGLSIAGGVLALGTFAVIVIQP
jgi:putative membrane protein